MAFFFPEGSFNSPQNRGHSQVPGIHTFLYILTSNNVVTRHPTRLQPLEKLNVGGWDLYMPISKVEENLQRTQGESQRERGWIPTGPIFHRESGGKTPWKLGAP